MALIVAATILADRKWCWPVLEKWFAAINQTPEIDRLYLNIQTSDRAQYNDLERLIAHQFTKPRDYDYWNIHASTWRAAPKYDQDNDNRLPPIAMARNMAIDYAMRTWATHLLFVDSDVVIHPGGVAKLLELDKPIAGGVVPGRGVHSIHKYIFGTRDTRDGCLQVAHGTCGYVLIQRSVFEVLRFRFGPHPKHRNPNWLSEDPAFAADAEFMGLSHDWWLHPEATAEHLDDPEHPLTEKEAIEGYAAS